MKKKLRLNVEELKVEAFITAQGAPKRGTVHGHDDSATDEGCYTSPGGWCTVAGDSCGGPDPGFCQVTRPEPSCYC